MVEPNTTLATVSSDLPSTAEDVAFVIAGLCRLEVQNSDLTMRVGDEDATIVVAIAHAIWQQFQNLSGPDREYVTSQVQHELAFYDRTVGPLIVPQTIGEDELPCHYLGLYPLRTAPSLVQVKTPAQLANDDSSWDATRQKLVVAMLKQLNKQINSKRGQQSLADHKSITLKFHLKLIGQINRLMKRRNLDFAHLFREDLRAELAKSGWELESFNFGWTYLSWCPRRWNQAYLTVRELKLPELGSR
jgi:hypothetical protein